MSTVLITGASSGIGFEFAKLFARDHDHVIMVSQDADRLGKAAEIIAQTYHTTPTVIVADLSQEHSAIALYQKIASYNLTVDILVNNAGFGDFSLFHESQWEKINAMMHLNMVTLTHLAHLFLPQMIARKHGSILNVASTAAFRPGPLMSVYYATKAFVLLFSEGIAEEVRGTGVSVTTLCPGATTTGFQAASHLEHSALIAGRQLAHPADVAAYGYWALRNKKGTVIHGVSNKFLIFLTRLLPRRLSARIIRFMQRVVQR
ncbi:MAG: hypothetical protein RIQ54_322 [Candidatus Parcubacteria bacterium]|jgi:short-subunit dehydrogenase